MASAKGRNKRHSHKFKKPREAGGVYRNAIAHTDCPVCGKKCYSSRRDAKEAAKIIFQGSKKVREYPCKLFMDGYELEYWHHTTQDTKTWTRWREYEHGQ